MYINICEALYNVANYLKESGFIIYIYINDMQYHCWLKYMLYVQTIVDGFEMKGAVRRKLSNITIVT